MAGRGHDHDRLKTVSHGDYSCVERRQRGTKWASLSAGLESRQMDAEGVKGNHLFSWPSESHSLGKATRRRDFQLV